MSIPRWYAVAGPAYLAALLAVDTQLGYHGQLVLGGVTWIVLLAALRPLPALARAQALGVVIFATAGEVTGSLVWGVYRYRLHNLPLFIPPAHGLVYLSGLALASLVPPRRLVAAAAVGAVGWGLAGLTVLPRRDVAGAIGVPLLCLFLWRSRSRAIYAGVFLVVGGARAVRHVDRHLALGDAPARHRHPGRQPAERCRKRVRVVRRDGAARRAVPRRPRAPVEPRDR